MNTGLKMTILGYLATMFTIGVNEMWHFWFVERRRDPEPDGTDPPEGTGAQAPVTDGGTGLWGSP
jgi:hypothetical protein